VSCDLRAKLDDRHATSHSAIELRHLKSDGTSANHRQMLGPRCPLQPIAGGRLDRSGAPGQAGMDEFDFLQAINSGNDAPRPRVYDNLIRSDDVISHAHSEAAILSSFQSGVTTHRGIFYVEYWHDSASADAYGMDRRFPRPHVLDKFLPSHGRRRAAGPVQENAAR
jgi:hypothetical protein